MAPPEKRYENKDRLKNHCSDMHKRLHIPTKNHSINVQEPSKNRSKTIQESSKSKAVTTRWRQQNTQWVRKGRKARKMVSGNSLGPLPADPKRLSLPSLGLHKSVYLCKVTRTSQRKRRGPRFGSPKRRPRLSKVCISLRTSFKNRRYMDATFKVG